ncbi:MAG: hypothetical protein FJX54_05535 [Alphaproteobacteria bacterium]|nr:hypothetical protein [Alphaproteobacteria bacterium]
MSLCAFGPYVFDSARRSLARNGEVLPLGVDAAEVLRRLLEARGGIVERQVFLAQIWGDAGADDGDLAAAIAALNDLLGAPVETLPDGYRFAAPVSLLPPAWWVAERRPPPKTRRFVRWVAASIPLLILLVFAALYLDQRWDAEARRLPPVRLAMLPFGADPTGPEGRLGHGLAEALIRQLSAQPRLAVRRTSEPVDGADYLLDGSVRREAGRLHVVASLVHVATGARRWTERFEETDAGPFRLQERLASRIARSLVPRFGAEDEAALRIPSLNSAEAWLLQIEGRGHLGEAELAPEAIAPFRQAIARDPAYAAAHAGLASAYMTMDDRRRAKDAAERALALDARNGEALAVLGDLALFHDWNWRAAEAAYHRAVAVSLNSVEAMEAHGWFLAAMGRHVEALAQIGRARRIDPARRRSLELLGSVRWMAGQPEPALAALDEAVALEPSAPEPHLLRVLLLDQLGRFDEAMAARRRWLVLADQAALGEKLARMQESEGYPAAMAEWLRFLDAPYETALQWMAIGERGRALEALERCVEARCAMAPFLRQHPPFLPLYRVPRFEALAERLKLPAPPS